MEIVYIAIGLNFIIAAVVGIIIAQDAYSRGMNGLGWAIFTFFAMIIAVLVYIAVRKPYQPNRTGTVAASKQSINPSNNEQSVYEEEYRKCPTCAEKINLEATKCRFCGEKFDVNDITKLNEERKLFEIIKRKAETTLNRTDIREWCKYDADAKNNVALSVLEQLSTHKFFNSNGERQWSIIDLQTCIPEYISKVISAAESFRKEKREKELEKQREIKFFIHSIFSKIVSTAKSEHTAKKVNEIKALLIKTFQKLVAIVKSENTAKKVNEMRTLVKEDMSDYSSKLIAKSEDTSKKINEMKIIVKNNMSNFSSKFIVESKNYYTKTKNFHKAKKTLNSADVREWINHDPESKNNIALLKLEQFVKDSGEKQWAITEIETLIPQYIAEVISLSEKFISARVRFQKENELFEEMKERAKNVLNSANVREWTENDPQARKNKTLIVLERLVNKDFIKLKREKQWSITDMQKQVDQYISEIISLSENFVKIRSELISKVQKMLKRTDVRKWRKNLPEAMHNKAFLELERFVTGIDGKQWSITDMQKFVPLYMSQVIVLANSYYTARKKRIRKISLYILIGLIILFMILFCF